MSGMLMVDSMIENEKKDVVMYEKKLPWLCRIRFCRQTKLIFDGIIEARNDKNEAIFMKGKVWQCPFCQKQAVILDKKGEINHV